MKKTIILGISALVLSLTSVVKADMSLSGYQEFFAGSADQTAYQGLANHGLDLAGMSNGFYGRVDANYSTTLDNGIEVSGTYNVHARDCTASSASAIHSANCNIVDFNFMSFSGGFGTISIGERFDTGASMLSRLTAAAPTGEPDGAVITAFYSGDPDNTFGSGNEVNYASAALKAVYMSNVFSGFSFAVGVTPNSGEKGGDTTNGQAGSGSSWGSYNDVLSVHGKYAMEMDGIGLELVYGQQTGNAGRIGTVDYNDLEETSYSALITYGNFKADYRKNEAGNSGLAKNGNAGGNEGTSICALYSMGNIGLGACQVSTSFTDSNNLSNSSETRTYSADYSLGGGVSLGVVYFDVEQTANSVTRTDVDGIATKLSIGF